LASRAHLRATRYGAQAGLGSIRDERSESRCNRRGWTRTSNPPVNKFMQV